MFKKKDDLKTFQKEALSAHNKFREKHGVQALKLSDDLSAHAQQWANHLASLNSLKHSNNKNFGENIAMSFDPKTTEFSGQQVTDQWYAEVKDYNFNIPGFRSGTGHFSQVVWKDSKEMGIGKAVAGNGKVFVVANYRPAGNVMSRFKENVFPLGSKKTKDKGRGRKGSTSSSSSSSSSSSEDEKKKSKFGFPKKKDRDSSKISTKISSTELRKFQKDALDVHNEYRSKHGVNSLRLSDDLCKSAQDWAEHLAKKDRFEHSKRNDIGENVAMHYSSATTEYSGKEACDQWYSELSKYDFKKPGFESGTGHFTQMVWKGSKDFGIGKAITKDGKVLVVGQYLPPGNVVGRYEENVFPRADGYRPPPSTAQTSKVTRVVRSTHYVVEDPPKTVDHVTRKVGGVKLKDADLSPSDLRTFQRDALEAHNKYRARHGVRSLRQSGELTRRAQDWAAHLAEHDLFKNSGNSDVGENIAMHYSSASVAFSGDEATDMFYRQIEKYNFKKPGFTSGAGHFTQLVWRDSREMGIGKTITKEGKVIVVAFYSPPGNVMGQFDTQVSKAGK
ncbi:uncharacterized protein LOC110983864 [Acanthaster planci]|uniref:Uncharacterized protein LOC110983864 n=1 Tax=Acanthaster planci TaxID=133434 RepID=A0A8B7Z0P4_ACAPL|nr:uncharacterized protein LOC110983864 [Acanthaster planci]XP_022099174.1 uncharacterized protein LOC110983864 [Acanthaster planci]